MGTDVGLDAARQQPFEFNAIGRLGTLDTVFSETCSLLEKKKNVSYIRQCPSRPSYTPLG